MAVFYGCPRLERSMYWCMSFLNVLWIPSAPTTISPTYSDPSAQCTATPELMCEPLLCLVYGRTRLSTDRGAEEMRGDIPFYIHNVNIKISNGSRRLDKPNPRQKRCITINNQFPSPVHVNSFCNGSAMAKISSKTPN